MAVIPKLKQMLLGKGAGNVHDPHSAQELPLPRVIRPRSPVRVIEGMYITQKPATNAKADVGRGAKKGGK